MRFQGHKKGVLNVTVLWNNLGLLWLLAQACDRYHWPQTAVAFKPEGKTMALWDWLSKVLMQMLENLLKNMSPEIREMFEKFVQEWFAAALETPNPWDDFGVRLLAALLGIELAED